jgi:hypothetical protein
MNQPPESDVGWLFQLITSAAASNGHCAASGERQVNWAFCLELELFAHEAVSPVLVFIAPKI